MPIENDMKTPKRYVGQTGVLSKGLAIIIVLYKYQPLIADSDTHRFINTY